MVLSEIIRLFWKNGQNIGINIGKTDKYTGINIRKTDKLIGKPWIIGEVMAYLKE